MHSDLDDNFIRFEVQVKLPYFGFTLRIMKSRNIIFINRNKDIACFTVLD
jgi:hypothetical protein